MIIKIDLYFLDVPNEDSENSREFAKNSIQFLEGGE